MDSEESSQSYRGKGSKRGEARKAKPGEVHTLLCSYHYSWHTGPGCSPALCSFPGLIRNPWVSAAGIIAVCSGDIGWFKI